MKIFRRTSLARYTIVLLAFAIIFPVLACLPLLFPERSVVSGEVMDKTYQPSPITLVPDKWTVILKTSEGAQPYIVTADIYYAVQIGEVVTLDCKEYTATVCLTVSDVGDK